MSWRSVPHKHTFWPSLFFGFLFFQGLFLVPQGAWADTAEMGGDKSGWSFDNPTSAPAAAPASGNTNNQAPVGGGAENASGKCSWYNFALSPVDCLLIPAIDALKLGVSWFAVAAAGLFIWVVDPASISGPTGILNKAEVYNLWKFIRDFFNLFFILILLLSAFATIFQVENFSIRRIFLNILFAALIINFSFPITRLLIDLTNVPMYYFLNAINLPGGGVAEAQGGKAFADQFLGSSGMGGIALQKSGSLGQALFGFVFMFLFTISLLVLGVLMLIRLIALTLLLIFSPIGFAASLLPGMSDLGHKWWGKFWQYAFFGPAAALVLLVAIRFQNEVGFDGTYASIRKNINNITGSSDESTSLSMLVFYLIPIILIWTAIGMANAFSIAGASKVTGWGETAAKWVGRKTGKVAWGATKGVGKFAGRKIEKKMAETKGLRWLSPTVLKTAWKARSEEQKHKDEAPVKEAAAQVQDKLNSGISKVFRNPMKWGTKVGVNHTDHKFAETTRQASEHKKEMSEVSTDSAYIIQELKTALDNKDKSKVDAALQILAKNNDMNDMILAMSQDDRYKGIKFERDKETNKVVVSSANMMKLLPEILKDSGEQDAEILAKKVMNISEQATGAGNFAFGGMTKFDPDLHGGHGGFRLARQKGEKYIDEDGNEQVQQVGEQALWAASKVKNLETQERQRKIHPDSVFTRTEDGFGDINGDVGLEVLKTFTNGDVEENKRSRDDLKAAMYNVAKHKDDVIGKDARGQDIYKYPEFRELYKNNGIIRAYADKIVKMKESPEDQGKKGNPQTPPKTTKEEAAAAIARELHDLENKKTTP